AEHKEPPMTFRFSWIRTFFARGRLVPWPYLALVVLLALPVGVGPVTQAWQDVRLDLTQPDRLSASQFSRLVPETSQGDGFFRSDNFVSNETSYLHIVDKLEQLGAKGGAYVGVGPEQNFTYIAKVRPRIAFIVDIRRQAVLQHLMYKALFHLSANRAEFL